ncbi:hypothetical protein P3X46_017405 [Hevea brasiliensis]|uniref:Uncharacterized protein n=1 Tax=Hevea brasiliensis TaxID=3981 RepID=A0ABQ9M275_HEVBR|nr:hypothetical protein P3X46_017405 [Hevea brasiliensis]
MVRDNWRPNSSFMSAVSHFTNRLKVWNKSVFRNIFHRKNCILSHLSGVQRSLNYGPTSFLAKKDLMQELEVLSHQEKLVRYQKSLSEFIKWGDLNTCYFHLKTINQGQQNWILHLKKAKSIWVHDQAELRNMAMKF